MDGVRFPLVDLGLNQGSYEAAPTTSNELLAETFLLDLSCFPSREAP